MLHLISLVLMRGIQLYKNFWNLSYPLLTTTQNDEKLHIFNSNSSVILSIWVYYRWRDIYRWDECIWTGVIKIGMRTCSKAEKYLIAHNFFNFDCNIGMLHLILLILMTGIQLYKNFWNLSYPLLTTTQNDEKLHIFDSNSLVTLSIWAYYT